MGSFRRVRCARGRWPTSRLRERKGGPPMPTTKRPGTRMTRTAGSARLVLLVSTRKGAWLFHGDGARRRWRVDGPHFLGQVINHLVLDPRDGRTLLAAAKTGHLGPTVFRSTDLGRRWKEATRPPAFAKAPESERGRAVDHTFWLTPGHASETGTWYAGTSPHGLFRSDDGGVTWQPGSGLNDTPRSRAWKRPWGEVPAYHVPVSLAWPGVSQNV